MEEDDGGAVDRATASSNAVNGAATKAKRKRKRRMVSRDYAVAVNKCRTFFESEAKEKSRTKVTRPLERAAACFDISQKTIIEIRRKLEAGEVFYDQKQRDRAMDVPVAFLPVVREAVLDMYVAKEHVTLDTLPLKLISDQLPCRWTWSRATLYRFLTNGMGFEHGERRTHYQNLKEDVAVVVQRIKYIRQVREYRLQNRRLYYQDETWVKKKMTPTRVWLDPEGNEGLKVPQGKGERCIISHIGWSGGFVDGTKLIFRGKKSLEDADYHTEMNATVFLDWLETRVFPAIHSCSVLILDRATYHTTLTEETKPAKSTFNKQ